MVTLFDQEKIWELHDFNIAREAEMRGMQQGMQRGRQEGRQEGIVAMALQLLKDGSLTLEKIAALAGLSVDEVKRLQAEQNT